VGARQPHELQRPRAAQLLLLLPCLLPLLLCLLLLLLRVDGRLPW
jgi:hypothetical protein